MGENHFAATPTALYGGVLLMSAIAYYVLQQVIIACQERDSELQRAIGSDWKGKLSPVLYIAAIIAAAWMPWLSQLIYTVVALIWLVPDRRIKGATRPHTPA